MFERIKKHYIDNSLGEFNLDELVELDQVEDNPVAITSSQEASTSSQVASTSSQVASTSSQVASSLNNVSIEEEEFEEESISEPAHKKRKTAVHPIYFVSRVCENEEEALAIIKAENSWTSHCRPNTTVNGVKSYYQCKHKGCSKKIGLWYDNTCTQVKILASNLEN